MDCISIVMMRTLSICLVFFGVLIENSVKGIRVPSDWRQQSNGPSDGFSRARVPLETRMQVGSEPANTVIYNSLPPTPPGNIYIEPTTNQMMVLSRNGFYILPQNTQEPLPVAPQRKQLPKIPRYSEPIQKRRSNKPYEGAKTDDIERYASLPSDVYRITAVETLERKRQLEQAQNKLDILNKLAQQYNSGVHKVLPKTPSACIPDTYVPRNHQQIPQNHKFIVTATEEESPSLSQLRYQMKSDAPVEVTTTKEPIFFVTEGYTNVLVQGPNKKKKYTAGKQHRDESRRFSNKEKLLAAPTNDDNPQRKRKVTKVYKIHENQHKVDNVGGSGKNVVQYNLEKPRKYFQRPDVYDGDVGWAGLNDPLTTNYRDDKTHEPSEERDEERAEEDEERDDRDNERSDEDDENISDEEDDESDDEAGNNVNTVTNKGINGTKEETDRERNTKTQDHKTDENVEENTEEANEEDDSDIQDEQNGVPQSEHADPKMVPTKPVYPGEGLWAKPGIKHRPYVSQHRFLKPVEYEEKPDGHDVFEELERYFNKQKDKFGNDFGERTNLPIQIENDGQRSYYTPQVKHPLPPNPIVVYDPFNAASRSTHNIAHAAVPVQSNINRGPVEVTRTNDDDSESKEAEEDNDEISADSEETDEDDEGSEESSDEFVPTRLYSQVRKTDKVEHEPYDPLEHGRLREVIKDSKVQTVYTEEGYEDSAYDHAGHEKKAEEDQGYAAFERDKQEKEKPKPKVDKAGDSHGGNSKKVEVSGEPLEDSIASDSVYLSSSTKNHIPLGNKEKPMSKSNNFISTQEVKTTHVKDKNNGDVQLEIQSEVEVIVQPNNSTKTHKYVKIYPKILKDIPLKEDKDKVDDVNFSNSTTLKPLDIALNESRTIGEEIRNVSGDISSSIYQEINNMAESTTESSTVSNIEILTKRTTIEKAKVVKISDDDGALKEITEQFSKIGDDLVRKKRELFESPFEEITIDTDFIDKINHSFAPPPPEIDVEKYPYYILPDINENSPLRYAENMDNIPIKKSGELSFYNMADKHACPDIPQNIDPIPEHVKKAPERKVQPKEDADSDGEDEADDDDDDDEESDEPSDENVHTQSSTPKTPRIQLGDKIDCLKARYFGENPLDSPFFKEETVGPVKPIFKELDPNAIKVIAPNRPFSPNLIGDNINKANEIFNQKDKTDEPKFENQVKDKIFKALTKSADKFEDIKSSSSTKVTSVDNEKAESIRTNTKIIKPIQHKPTPLPLVTLITTPKYTIQLTPNNIYDQIKILDHLPEEEVETESEPEGISTTTEPPLKSIQEQSEEVSIENIRNEENDVKREESINRQKKVEESVRNNYESSNRQAKMLLGSGEDAEERIDSEDETATVLEPEALRRRRVRPRRPVYQIFDVTRFLTTTPFSVINTAPTTVLPKHKVLSEVFYKEEIKPSEQLNVFADVLNNIKNSSKVEAIPIQSASDFAEPSAVTIKSWDEPTEVPQISSTKGIKKIKHNGSPYRQNTFEETKPLIKPPVIYKERIPQVNSVRKHYRRPPTRRPTTSEPTEDDLPSSTSATRKILKKRRKPMTRTSTTVRTTTNIQMPNQDTPSNHQPYVIDFIDDNDEVIGLMPPQNFQYKTIMVDDSEVKETIEVPNQIYHYQKILPLETGPADISKHPAPVTEIHDESPPVPYMNNYYVLGLKPPPQQRARPYSEFANKNILVNDNLLRRRVAHIGLSRAKRSAARPAYADVSRNRGRQNEGLDKSKNDEVDDYVPHRPKNYHYDEKTGKIVYHTKPTEKPDEEDDDVEYEEIEVPDTPGIYLERADDATQPTPEKVTTKELLATATPPPEGQGLLDFVVKLKNDPSYKYIPDPTTPKPGSVATTTESFVTPDPKSTDPPEFLSILSKVKSDKTYKFIEDPKENQSKLKSKSTTPAPEEEEYEDDEDEDTEPDKQNSRPKRQITRLFDVGVFLPRVQAPIRSNIPTNFFMTHIVERIFPRLRYMTLYDIARERYKQTGLYKFLEKHFPRDKTQDLGNIQIFDISDYLPKIDSAKPKTTIDYSKYKTIERPHHAKPDTKDEEPEKDSVEIMSKPQFNRGGQPSQTEAEIHKETAAEEKREEERLTSTTEKIVLFRRGSRPTTAKVITEPKEKVTTRRSTNRRRPLPSGFTTTKRSSVQVTEPTEKVERIYPENYASDEKLYTDAHDKARRVYRRRPVRIRHTTERQEENEETVDKIVQRSLDSDIDDVRNEFQRESLDNRSIEEAYEDIKDEIINDDREDDDHNDEDKNTSGTNKREIVEVPKHVEIIDNNYDRKKKHGGNYKREQEDEEEVIEGNKNTEPVETSRSLDNDNKKKVTAANKITKDVEIINKNYDQTKKHGGNYRRPPEEEEEEKEIIDDTQVVAAGIKPIVETSSVKKDNNPAKEQERLKKLDVEIINPKFDRSQKHGGNYKSEEDAVVDELLESNKDSVAKPQKNGKKYIEALEGTGNIKEPTVFLRKTNYSVQEIPKLADISPKPDHYYSDPQLPEQVNTLRLPSSPTSEEVAEVVSEGDFHEGESRRNIEIEESEEEEKVVPTKKPLFIKDPSKRLYYYAPV